MAEKTRLGARTLLTAGCLGLLMWKTALGDVIVHADQLTTQAPFERNNPNPLLDFTDYLWNSEWYDSLIAHPSFLKAQQMAQRVWDVQTGKVTRKHVYQDLSQNPVSTTKRFANKPMRQPNARIR